MSLVLLCAGTAFAAPATIVLHGATTVANVLASAQAADGRDGTQSVLVGTANFRPYSEFPRARVPSAIWLRVSLVADPDALGPWVLTFSNVVWRAEVYIPTKSGYVERVVGTSQPFRSHREPYTAPAVELNALSVTPQTLLMHVQYYPDAPLAVRVRSLTAMHERGLLYHLVEGLFFGVMLAVGLSMLYFAFVMRDRGAAYFVGFIVALVANELVMTGVGAQYLWTGLALPARWVTYFTGIATLGMFVLFARSFLATRESAPLWDRLLIAAFVAPASIDLIRHVVYGGDVLSSILLCVQLLSLLTMAVTGAVRMAQGYRPARFFVIAFVPAMIGVFATLVYNVYTPAEGNWFLAENGAELGSMLQALILTFSLLDRIRSADVARRVTQDELARTEVRNLQLRQLATHDPLTSIANRLAFVDLLARRIGEAKPSNTGLAVLFIDLDDFKAVNDEFGHRVGDALLQIVARRLQGSVRTGDAVARLGGDEFAVLVTGAAPPVVERIREQIAHMLDAPVVYEGVHLPIGLSVGIALFPRDGESVDALLDAADRDMYRVKELRKRRRSGAKQSKQRP